MGADVDITAGSAGEQPAASKVALAPYPSYLVVGISCARCGLPITLHVPVGYGRSSERCSSCGWLLFVMSNGVTQEPRP
jgi:hypothetical protein